nr:MAG TPA: hypothetical protein [Caudoviricetes sp.]
MNKITRTIKTTEVAYRTVKNGALSDEVKTIHVMGSIPAVKAARKAEDLKGTDTVVIVSEDTAVKLYAMDFDKFIENAEVIEK